MFLFGSDPNPTEFLTPDPAILKNLIQIRLHSNNWILIRPNPPVPAEFGSSTGPWFEERKIYIRSRRKIFFY